MNKIVGWLAFELPKYWKAVLAAIPAVTLVGAEIVQAIENGAQDGSLTTADMLGIALTTATAVAVYAKGNKPAPELAEH